MAADIRLRPAVEGRIVRASRPKCIAGV